MTSTEIDTESRTIATAWASSDLGRPSPEDDVTAVTATAPTDDDRGSRRGPVILFGASCVIAGVSAIGALLFSTPDAQTVRIEPGVTESGVAPAPAPSSKPTVAPTKPAAVAPAPTGAPAPVAAQPPAPAPQQTPAPAPQQPEPAPPSDEADDTPPLPPLSDHPEVPAPLPPLSDHPVTPQPPVADIPDITAPLPAETPDPPKPVIVGPSDLTVKP